VAASGDFWQDFNEQIRAAGGNPVDLSGGTDSPFVGPSGEAPDRQDFVAAVNPFRQADNPAAYRTVLSDEALSGDVSGGEFVDQLRGAGDPDTDVFRGGDPLDAASGAADTFNRGAGAAAASVVPDVGGIVRDAALFGGALLLLTVVAREGTETAIGGGDE
jgi:hypothetical protein